MKMRYLPRIGARITPKQAQFIGEIAERAGGLQGEDAPRALVAASGNRRAPTHALFSGSDKAKAKKWDLQLARQLLGSVRYEVVADAKFPNARAIMHLPATEEATGGYFPMEAASKSPDLRERVVDEVERRVKSARVFAGGVTELLEILDAALVQIARVKRKGKAA